MTEWGTVTAVLAKFPPAAPPPYIPPPTAPKRPAAPAKSELSGCAWTAVIVGFVCLGGFILLGFLAGIAMGPIMNGVKKAQEAASMQEARVIALGMYQYSLDHNGVYPDGKTSTEVFQKLLDGNYVSSPAAFYFSMPGKVRATSKTLLPQNVCFDVTSGVTADSPGDVPLVFSTGYSVRYSAGSTARLTTLFPMFLRGIAVAYKDNSAAFKQADATNSVPDFIPDNFVSDDKIYVQLEP
jgi:type II secretory pathway pseudopilin PulG